MLDFAVKLTLDSNGTDQSDIESLRRHGFDDQAILEITHIVGFFNHINRVADALGVEAESSWSEEQMDV